MPKPIQKNRIVTDYPIITERAFSELAENYQLTNPTIERGITENSLNDVTSDITDVGTDEYHISTHSKTLLYTYGLGPCIGLLLYSHANDITLLAHFYANNPTLDDDFTEMLTEYESTGGELTNTQAILFGGRCDDKISIKCANTLIHHLQRTPVLLDSLNLFPRKPPFKPRPTASALFDPNKKTLTIDVFLDKIYTVTLNAPEPRLSLSH